MSVWAPIPDWEGIYEASTDGNIRSVDRVIQRSTGPVSLRGRVLIPAVSSTSGHLKVRLQYDGRTDHVWVHRVVLLAHVGPAPEGHVARHLNGLAADNRLDNLAWDTRAENMRDVVRHGVHAMALRTHCPRGHVLAPPNLVAPRASRSGPERSCLACGRTSANRSTARKRGVPFDEEATMQRHYDRIMGVPA